MTMRALVSLLLFASLPALADVVQLKNGDKITGTISSSDLTSVDVKTDYAGTVTIKWEAVKSVTSDKPVYVAEKSGAVLNGTLSASNSSLTVATANGPVTVQKTDVSAVRSEADQKAYGAWGGAIDTGLSLSRGNSDTTNFSLGGNVARSTAQSKTSAFITTLYAKSSILGVNQTTASAAHAGIRYDHNLSDKTFLFVEDDIDHDRFQELDAREVIAAGFGDHFIKTANTTLDLSVGASYNNEFFSTLHRQEGEVLLGEDFTHKLSSAFAFKESFQFFPDISNVGQYRFAFDTAAVTKISKSFSWQVDLTDHYLSNPILGLKGNDLLLTTGLHYSFGAGKGL